MTPPTQPDAGTPTPRTELIVVNAALLRLFHGQHRNPGERHNDRLFVRYHMRLWHEQVGRLSEEVRHLNKLNAERWAKLISNENEVSDLRAQLAAMTAERDAAHLELSKRDEADEAFGHKWGDLQHDMACLRERCEGYSQAWGVHVKRIEELEAQLATLRQQNEALRRDGEAALELLSELRPFTISHRRAADYHSTHALETVESDHTHRIDTLLARPAQQAEGKQGEAK